MKRNLHYIYESEQQNWTQHEDTTTTTTATTGTDTPTRILAELRFRASSCRKVEQTWRRRRKRRRRRRPLKIIIFTSANEFLESVNNNGTNFCQNDTHRF